MESLLIGMLNDICGSDIFNAIFETLTINLFSDEGKFSVALNHARLLHENVIKPLAIMLMFIYFIIALVDKFSSDNFTWEQLWRQLAMLLAAKILIEHGFELLELLFGIGMTLASSIQESTGYFGDKTEEVANAKEIINSFREGLGATGVFKTLADLVMVLFLIFPWLFSWIMRLCVSIICYTRVIEIYIRASFAPIALSDFFHSGLQGAGWRFIKSFLAVCLQGAMILVIAVIFSALMKQISADDQNLFTFIGKYIAFFASSIMLMFKSLSLTKELIGVN